MTGLVWGLIAALIVSTALLAYVASRLAAAHAANTGAHAACIAHVTDMVSNRIVANAYRDLARRWDSVEERSVFNRLRLDYRDGQSIGSRWLLMQAEALDPTPDFEMAEYTFDGRRIL